jgi:hypothetical protein
MRHGRKIHIDNPRGSIGDTMEIKAMQTDYSKVVFIDQKIVTLRATLSVLRKCCDMYHIISLLLLLLKTMCAVIQ